MAHSTVITVQRPVTVLLLLAATTLIIFFTLDVSGKSYSKVDPIPFEDIRHLTHRIAHRPVSTQILAVIIMPIVANVLLFTATATTLGIVAGGVFGPQVGGQALGAGSHEFARVDYVTPFMSGGGVGLQVGGTLF